MKRKNRTNGAAPLSPDWGRIRAFCARFWRMFSPYGRIGWAVLLLIFLMGGASLLFSGDSYSVPSGASLEAPGPAHPLGTDDLGIDILAQLGRGAVISLAVGLSSALLAGLGGGVAGMMAGYAGGKADRLICGLCDIVSVMPQLPLMIVLGAFFGPSVKNIILVITLLSWAGPARIARSKTLSLRRETYITAARSYGASFFHILKKHLLPGLFPVLMVSALRIIGHAVVAEASLTFLGLGDPTSKSWGVILNRAMGFPGIYYTPFWTWWILPPLAALTLLVLSVSWIGRDLERTANRKL